MQRSLRMSLGRAPRRQTQLLWAQIALGWAAVGCAAGASDPADTAQNGVVGLITAEEGGAGVATTQTDETDLIYAPTCDANGGSASVSGAVVGYTNPVGLGPDTSVMACGALDSVCIGGRALSVRGSLPGFAGRLPIGFEGFLRIDAPNYVRTELWLGHRVCGDMTAPTVYAFDAGRFEMFFNVLGLAESLFQQTTTLLVTAVDCENQVLSGEDAFGDPVRGLTFRLAGPFAPDAGTLGLTFVNFIPVLSGGPASTVEFDLSDRAEFPYVGWVGVRPGVAVVEVYNSETGNLYGSAAVLGRPGQITYAHVVGSGACPRSTTAQGAVSPELR